LVFLLDGCRSSQRRFGGSEGPLPDILSKLEVSSRLQALVFAVRHGVVTIE
jgi:hypothetical protein